MREILRRLKQWACPKQFQQIIRVAGKKELIDRIHLYCEQINADPVIFRWKYKMDEISIV